MAALAFLAAPGVGAASHVLGAKSHVARAPGATRFMHPDAQVVVKWQPMPSKVTTRPLKPLQMTETPAEMPAQNDTGTNGLNWLKNLVLFAAYFLALLGTVGRAVLETTLPHQRILLVALAVILPDLARFSFTGLTQSPNALRKARNPDHIDPELFPRHYSLCTLTTVIKLLGFAIAGYYSVELGAFLVILGQAVINSFIQLRFINGQLFQLRRQDRGGVLLMEVVMLIMLGCVMKGVYPIMFSSLFLSMVTAYWLGKYDCQLFS